MKIAAHLQAIEAAKHEANEYVQNSDVKSFKPLFEGLEWKDLYENIGIPEMRDNYKKVFKTLKESLAQPISDKVDTKGYTQAMFEKDLYEAETAFHYRLLNVLGKEADEESNGWASKSLCRFDIITFIERNNRRNPMVEGARAWYRDQEINMVDRLYNIPLGDGYMDFDSIKGKHPIQEIYQDFVEKGRPEEVIGFLIEAAQRLDGIRDHHPKDLITNIVVSKAVSALYNEPDFGISDIAHLRITGVVTPVKFWDTEYFHNHQAPVITDEYVNKFKENNFRFNVESPIMALKSELEPKQILAHFLDRGRTSEIASWKYAMAACEVLTGERVSFKQAQEMHKECKNFTLENTQVYSDWMDGKMDPVSYRNIKVSVDRTPDEDYKFDENMKAVYITLECKSLSIDSINNVMSNQMLAHTAIQSCCETGDGMWFEVATDAPDPIKASTVIANQLVATLEDLNRATKLPGDVVRVDHEDASDWELKHGNKHMITDIDRDGRVKLKGNAAYVPGELLKLQRKYPHEPQRAPVGPSL